MKEEQVREAVVQAMARSEFARVLAEIVGEELEGAGTGTGEQESGSEGAKRLLTKVVLGDILDDSILAARPGDRTFPLRVFFGELGTLLAHHGQDGPGAHAADVAFTVASGLNFFFRAAMDPEAKMRVGLEVSRQVYTLAHDAKLDDDVVAKATPLLAALMSSELERVRFETVDHTKVFDSQLHERAADSDATSSRILRPASFLCRVQSNNAVKAKAQVVT